MWSCCLPRGLSLAETSYSKKSTRILGIVDKLRALGVSGDLELPTIVVCGDQSSGKSSVVEALAEISLPRAAGTCTRCPTEVRMRTFKPDAPDSPNGNDNFNGNGNGNGNYGNYAAAAWCCRIKLRVERDEKNQLLGERPPEELFWTVYDKSHITLAVTAAQAVLLNPTKVKPRGSSAFVPMFPPPGAAGPAEHSPAFQALGEATGYELQFTHNTVVLEVDGAEADLTIVDLPGIIHAGGESYVDLVRSMTKDNIEPGHHILVTTLSAMADLETQAIKLWSRKADPHGTRTLAVITKPDNIPAGEHSKWLRLLTSPQPDNDLRLGYYVVKNPAQPQLDAGITFLEAREAEAQYFDRDLHWSAASAANPALKSRLGAKSLRNALSGLLVERVHDQLPEIQQRARAKLEEVRRGLAALPPAPAKDPLYELFDILSDISKRLSADLLAQSESEDGNELYQKLDGHYTEFGSELVGGMPCFHINGRLISAITGEDSGHGDSIDIEVRLPGRPVAVRMALDDDSSESGKRLRAEMKEAGFPSSFMSLEEVMALHKKYQGRELPTFIPYRAVEALIQHFNTVWGERAMDCQAGVEEEVREAVGRIVKEVAGRYPDAANQISMHLSDYIDELAEETSKRLQGVMEMERENEYTENRHYFRSQYNIFLGRLKCAHLDITIPDDDAEVNALLAKLAGKLGVDCDDGISTAKELVLCMPCDADDELAMMAACMAYYKVVFKRVQDEVPLHIKKYLLAKLADRQGLQQLLRTRVLGDDPLRREEVAKSMLSEDASIADRRMQLLDRQRRLGDGIKLLHAA